MPVAVDHWARTLASHARAGPEAEVDCGATDNELRNLYALNLREINGILDRCGKNRMNPILQLDQQQQLRQMVERTKTKT